jgi:hypothetical protein
MLSTMHGVSVLRPLLAYCKQLQYPQAAFDIVFDGIRNACSLLQRYIQLGTRACGMCSTAWDVS